MIARRLVITGRVQGVGYRDWLVIEAGLRGVHGWVRNRRDGAVEAVLYGQPDQVALLIAACGEGPRHAAVDSVEDHPADPQPPGFRRLPTA
jgi:acylphosphatase